MSPLPILIVGAGPTGLVLALSLSRFQIPIRIIDAAAGPGTQSRATVVHARTLEFYRQFGFADEVVNEGIPFTGMHMRRPGSNGQSYEVARWDFGMVGKGLSPFPFILTHPQDLHERLLIRHLEALGICVERNTKLTGFTQDADKVVAELETWDGVSTAEFSYICGCDGSHSIVREILDTPFRGGTYDRGFFIADVTTEVEFEEDIYFNLGVNNFALMMPVRGTGSHRLIGTVPPALAGKANLSFDDVRDSAEDSVGSKVTGVNWFSQYHSHHKLAEHFRQGQAFLLGDAAHVHSPVGGQGMNTGIGDAVNLAWKLAAVCSGKAGPILLESYEPERRAFAEKLVSTTDQAFKVVSAPSLTGAFFRRIFAPVVGFLISRFAFARRMGFKTVSQIRIEYRHSVLSHGKIGSLVAGDRLPWVNFGKTDNFDTLKGLDWQLHIYGDVEIELGGLDWIPLYRFPFTKTAYGAGLRENAVYLIRPDGYVGLAIPQQNLDELRKYVEKLQLRKT